MTNEAQLKWAERYVGRRWKELEFEEQAHVRELMRAGRMTIEGTGPDRRVVWTLKSLTHPFS